MLHEKLCQRLRHWKHRQSVRDIPRNQVVVRTARVLTLPASRRVIHAAAQPPIRSAPTPRDDKERKRGGIDIVDPLDPCKNSSGELSSSALEVPRGVRILREAIVSREPRLAGRPDAVGALLLERDQVELRGGVVLLHRVVVVLRGASVGLVVVVRDLPEEPAATSTSKLSKTSLEIKLRWSHCSCTHIAGCFAYSSGCCAKYDSVEPCGQQ